MFLAAVHCFALSNALQEKGSSVWRVASMSLYERVQKDALVGPSFTQGPRGWTGSSGARGSKASERGRNKEPEEKREMGRDGSHGR